MVLLASCFQFEFFMQRCTFKTCQVYQKFIARTKHSLTVFTLSLGLAWAELGNTETNDLIQIIIRYEKLCIKYIP